MYSLAVEHLGTPEAVKLRKFAKKQIIDNYRHKILYINRAEVKVNNGFFTPTLLSAS